MTITRQEFESLLKQIYNPQVFTDSFQSFESVMTNDKEKMDIILTRYLRAQGRIQFYLTEYDNAPTDPEKDAVVGSVDGILGEATVNPDDARLWPPTDGVWGNIYNANAVTDNAPVQWDGTSGMLLKEGNPVENLVRFNASVDGTNVGDTLIFTSPASKRFIPISSHLMLLDVVGLSLVATVSMGTNASTYNNIMGATLLTGLNAENQIITNTLNGPYASVAPSTQVFCRVSIASTATTYQLMASLVGYFLDE